MSRCSIIGGFFREELNVKLTGNSTYYFYNAWSLTYTLFEEV
jgi:hypothetical protein